MILLAWGCGTPPGGENREQVHGMPNVQADTLRPPEELTAELQQTIDSALQLGFTRIANAPRTENPFGLLDPGSVFGPAEQVILQGGRYNHIVMEKKGARVSLDEYVLASSEQALQINNALTQPMKDKTQERFFRYPLTFFPFKNRMYYLSTSEEKYRGELNELNTLLVNMLTTE
ncbi:MAG: hypothetical protein AB1458_02680 [Bacteroidota bacterium]